MSAKRPGIVVTGVGAVCAAGSNVDEIWSAIIAGKSGIGPLQRWDATNWPVKLAGEVTGVDNRTLVDDRKLHKMITRTDMLGLYAAESAIKRSGMLAQRDLLDADTAAKFNDRCGVFAGSGGGNYQTNYDFIPALTTAAGNMHTFGREFPNSVNPMWLLRILPNNVVCHVGIRNNLKGTNACITNHCVGGVMAVAEATAALRAGEADRAVAVGHDAAVDPETIFYYHRFGLMAGDAVRSFDRQRAGTILGEGAAAVLLETAEGAQARQANVIGEILGAGCITEATGVLDVRADGDGLCRAIEVALADAGISPAEVGMIVAHANGTRNSDASEAAAIRRVFGANIPPVTGFKWAYGHTLASAGSLDLAIALRALRERVVPGIPTLREVDPEFGAFPVSPKPQTPRSDTGLVLCRGFGGMNVALVVRVR